LNEVYIDVDDVEEEDIDDAVSVKEALGVEEGI
jgi:exoribonuclease R